MLKTVTSHSQLKNYFHFIKSHKIRRSEATKINRANVMTSMHENIHLFTLIKTPHTREASVRNWYIWSACRIECHDCVWKYIMCQGQDGIPTISQLWFLVDSWKTWTVANNKRSEPSVEGNWVVMSDELIGQPKQAWSNKTTPVMSWQFLFEISRSQVNRRWARSWDFNDVGVKQSAWWSTARN